MAPTEQQRKAAKAAELAGGKKVPNARVQRYLKSTASQLTEPGKSVLLLKGIKASASMGQVLQELRALQAPAAKLLSKKNQIVAFGDMAGQQSLEFLTTKNDCALFAMASHNKKRPNNLIMGRTFDRQILDLTELGIVRFKSALRDYGGTVPKKRVGSKPLLLFCGDAWQLASTDLPRLQNLLIDFYRGQVVHKLVATGLDHIMVFTAAAAPNSSNNSNSSNLSNTSLIIHQRTYFCKLKKNPHDAASKTPVPYLEPCGPDLDFVVRRTEWAEPDLYKAARRQPAANKNKTKSKKKNQSTNLFGETVGRLHLEKQNLQHAGGRKVKALRRAEQAAAAEERAAVESELEREKQQEGAEFEQTFGFAESELAMEQQQHASKKQKKSGKQKQKN